MGLTDGNSTTAVATATATAAAVATAAPTYCNTVSGITVRIISLRSPHLVGYQYLALRDVDAAVDSACGLYSIPRQQPPSPPSPLPPYPDCGSAPWAQAARKHRWPHIQHSLFHARMFPARSQVWATPRRHLLPSSGTTSSGRAPDLLQPGQSYGCDIYLCMYIAAIYMFIYFLHRLYILPLYLLYSLRSHTYTCGLFRTICMYVCM